MKVEILQILWYLVVMFALICYSILDGFDLGVGALHLFSKKDRDRRIFLNAIGPFWDGNEVWLVIIGGALFAGFPEIYATIFSAFYLPCMGLLCALIFRAVAIEFRSKLHASRWRNSWDVIFSISSIAISFLSGVILTNLVQGIAINQERVFTGSVGEFFTPYTILGGTTVVALYAMHGAIYLLMKTEGQLHDALRRWMRKAILFFVICYVALSGMTLLLYPYMIKNMISYPVLFVVPLLVVACIVSILYLVKNQKEGWGFVCSCLNILFLSILLGVGTYPVMVRSNIDPQGFSLTLFNSASSKLSLTLLLTIVVIGVPCVLGYGYYIYNTFKGKVSLDSNSY